MSNDMVFYRPKKPCFLPSFSLAISSQLGASDPRHYRETCQYNPQFVSALTAPPIDFMKTIDLRSDNDSDYRFQYTVTGSQEKIEDLHEENVELDSVLDDDDDDVLDDFEEPNEWGVETEVQKHRWTGIVHFFIRLVPKHRLLWKKTSPVEKAPSDYLLDLSD
ncbi:hypothetical protein BDQ12DRAFT_725055 [Crucibulum laeve]|uniref:Uncharacterized protein n=1 Tax=Crucibulum laeve TaxID=68775 RepID=A0A5C3M649_9AGAR|nr:hypothetical protein BDQ12DRAFT_725055 [Crucibulum laeve]